MWCARSGAIHLTKVTSEINLIKPKGVLRLVTSQANCRCSLSVDVTRLQPRYMSSQPKRLCTGNMTVTKIGTHNGTFHCDEVLACFFLRQLPEYKVGPACSDRVLWRDGGRLYCSLNCCRLTPVFVFTISA